jgi:hypothetical protein
MRAGYASVCDVLFWIVLVFQVSILPDVLGIGFIARIANIFAVLVFLVGALGMLSAKRSQRVLYFYVFPIMLVIAGYAINILRSGRIEALSHFGLILPWFAALSVPFILRFDYERYWRLFYRFMIVVSVVALVEYGAVFAGLLSPTSLTTRYGEFVKGVFTIFHSLDDDVVYNRMYGVFAEPGTYAMFLLLALSYALVHKRVIAAVVFMTCMVFTASLGGYLGLVILLLTHAYWIARRKSATTVAIIGLGALLVLALAAGPLIDFLTMIYENRAQGESLTVRQSNVSLFFVHFFDILFSAPFGMELKGEALSTLQGSDPLYIGSNFTVGNALVLGGLLSLLGYTMFLIANTLCWLQGLLRHEQGKLIACVYISFPALMSFVVQRTTVFDSALYSFLFAAPLLAVMRRAGASSGSDLTGIFRLARD